MVISYKKLPPFWKSVPTVHLPKFDEYSYIS